MQNWRSKYKKFATLSEKFSFLCSFLDNCKTQKAANEALQLYTGGLSTPSKMPCYSYNIPAWECKTGKILMKVKGSTCASCYAMKGRYVFTTTKNALYRRFATITQNFWVEAMTLSIAIFENSGYFRWHDSGDIQDLQHLDNIVQIAKNLPEVKFWLPTREYKFVSDYKNEVPENLTIRLSAHLVDSYKEVSNKIGSITVSSEAVFQNMQLDNANVCHATRTESSHKCETCRGCWDKTIKTIAYLKH
jgi:hypothetical protein